MGLLDSINEHLRRLPPSDQAEVLDFVSFLEAKKSTALVRELDEWSSFSLDAAMRGIDVGGEEVEYSIEDLRETY